MIQKLEIAGKAAGYEVNLEKIKILLIDTREGDSEIGVNGVKMKI